MPLLSKHDQTDDIEIITLDDDDVEGVEEHPSLPQPISSNNSKPIEAPASSNHIPEVIDVDDDDALANLQPQQNLREQTNKETKLHVSRGGGLFREQPSGQLEIVDSDEEDHMTQTHHIVSREDGLYTVSTQPQATPIETSNPPLRSLASLPPHRDARSDIPTSSHLTTPMANPSPLPSTLPPLLTTNPQTNLIASSPHPVLPTSIMQWPLLQRSLSPNVTQSLPLQNSGPSSSPEAFSQAFVAGAINQVTPYQTLPAQTSASQTDALRHVQGTHGTLPPAHSPTWLNARSPQALWLAQKRIALSRGITSPATHAIPSSTAHLPQFNPSQTAVTPTQVIAPTIVPRNDNVVYGKSFAATDEGGMSEEGLRNLVRQNGLTADATEEAETPRELTVTLMPHQKRALHWMLRRESHAETDETDEEVSAVEEQCLGGILADDQGLGKTLSMIALLVRSGGRRGASDNHRESSSASNDSVDLEKESDNEHEVQVDVVESENDFVAPDRSEVPPWRTLIICPGSVIGQWREELRTRIKEDFNPSVCVYHGPKRERRVDVLENCDVVITTYATLVHEYPKILKKHHDYERRKKEKLPLPKRREGPLCRVSWNRVVLDEAQHVKNRGTDSWFAVMSLKAEKRWCLTGTPIQNSVDDIFSLFCFIRYRFVPNVETWNTRWKKKLESSYAYIRERAFKRFQTIVGVVLLRRTKNDTINGSALINLPKRLTDTQTPEFCDKEEEAVYRAVQEKSVLTVNKFLAAGTLANNYSSVLLMLLRLRQACSHPFLIEYAGMQTRGRSVSSNSDGFASLRYSTNYERDDLEEALELATGGFSFLSLIDDVARPRVEAALAPPARGTSPTAKVSCLYCQRETPWHVAVFLPCGDLFCPDCCSLLRSLKKCLRCGYALEAPEVGELFINADQLRKEVHANIILAEDRRDAVSITASEFKAWFQLEIIKRRSGISSESVTPDTTDAEIGDEGDDDDDDALDLLEKSILEKKHKDAHNGQTRDDSPETLAHKHRLLKALSQHSTKILKILEKLREIKGRDQSEKTLIFSQWTSMLDIIEFHVQLEGHEICRLDGSMTLSARQKQVELFKTSATHNVFLISLAAGGTGLNLTAASNVILTDVWWNPAVEEQAIDRAHRIGQKRDVNVTRFRMKGTVEEKIYALCAKKKEAANGTLGVTGAQSLGRKRLSLEELMYIFGGAARDVAQSANRGSAVAEAAQNILQYQRSASL